MSNKEYTQWDLVVLELARRGTWTKAYELENVFVGNQKIGSEADTRCYELFDKCVTDQPLKETERKIGNKLYIIQTKKDGDRRVYKAYEAGLSALQLEIREKKAIAVQTNKEQYIYKVIEGIPYKIRVA